MALDAAGQAVVDAIAAATTKTGVALADVADAIKQGTQAITDLVAAKGGSVTLADIQPSLDTINAGADAATVAADAFKATATAADPAVTPAAPPIAQPVAPVVAK